MKTHKSAFASKFILFAFALLLISCTKEPSATNSNTNNGVEITITPHMAAETLFNVKSTTENIIDNLLCAIYNSEGRLISFHNLSTTSTTTSISTTTGFKTVVILGNSKLIDLSIFNTIDKIRLWKIDRSKITENRQPLYGEISAEITKGANLDIKLKRLTTKISFAVDLSELNSDIELTFNEFTLKQIPEYCSLGGPNQPLISEISSSSISKSLIGVDLQHNDQTSLYIFENMQGCSGQVIGQSNKSPEQGKENLCTYLEVNASYKSSLKSGQVKYRYWLGKNITDDFNLERNSWYKVTLKLKGTAIEEAGWRVDKQELYDLSVPVSGIVLNKSSDEVILGSKLTLTATVLPSNASDKTIVWSSSDNTIATINQSGEITTLKEGQVKLIATTNSGGYKAECTLNVIKEIGLFFNVERKITLSSGVIEQQTETIKLCTSISPATPISASYSIQAPQDDAGTGILHTGITTINPGFLTSNIDIIHITSGNPDIPYSEVSITNISNANSSYVRYVYTPTKNIFTKTFIQN